ncbi:MAG: DUF1844 domain-containing protein [Candidatus Latescibacterota bacterium]|nr:MAG: DUF1844 domain-containing protein [Candidatus Latescibacterota bacterium]
MSEAEANRYFLGLLFSLHSSAWMHLGKVTNPVTGKSERNMDAAKETIDLIGALEEKTRGNLVADEEKLMRQLLTELRVNYVDELKRAPETEADASAPAETSAEASRAETTGTGDSADDSAAESTGADATDDRSERPSS